MLSVSRTCFNEFLSLLDVAWVNKVLLLLLLLSSVAWDFRLEFVQRGNVKQIVSLLNALIRD